MDIVTPEKLILYKVKDCGRCAILKTWLETYNIPFEEKDLDDTNIMADLIMRNVFVLSAPVLEVDGKFIEDNDLFFGNTLQAENLERLLLSGFVLEKER